MPVYIDLHPAPQFDRSLVTYCTINFGRVKDGLGIVGKQVYQESWWTTGPWPVNIGVFVPYFKADVQIWAEISYFTNAAPNFIAMALTWDGFAQSPFLEQYFNENFAKKSMSTMMVIRNQGQGWHTLSQMAVTGGVLNDSNDVLKQNYTYYEL